MALRSNPYEEHIAARLLDFFGKSTHWTRRLWGVGIFLMLREVLEAAKAVQQSVLTEGAIKTLADEAKRAISKDPAIAIRHERQALMHVLGGNHHADGFNCRRLEQQIAALQPLYLRRWADVLDSARPPKAERVARAIAAHLLDRGFSDQYLHRWWTYRLRQDQARSLSDVLRRDSDELTEAVPKAHKILVALAARPKLNLEGIPAWRSPPQVKAWWDANGVSHGSLRQYGGLVFEVNALDHWGAVEKVAEIIDSLAARFAVGTRGRELRTLPQAWPDGVRGAGLPLRDPRRVEVRTLSREEKLLALPSAHLVDAAIHLLGPLNDGPASSAVAGGWAAIETVLSMPGDRRKSEAAYRLAGLVACSWSRAELTSLSYRYEEQESPDEGVLAAVRNATNRDRAHALATGIQNGAVAAFPDKSDQAAVERMREVLADPRSKLLDVRQHACSALHRLYRQRNLVLHGGNLNPVALRSGLRAAAPLVGAGFDRIAHAWFVDETDPKDLAARASVRLEHLNREHAVTAVIDLLER